MVLRLAVVGLCSTGARIACIVMWLNFKKSKEVGERSRVWVCACGRYILDRKERWCPTRILHCKLGSHLATGDSEST